MNEQNTHLEKSDAVKKAMLEGHAVTVIENDTQKQIAMQNPRNEERILDNSLRELELDPQVAEKAFYSIPYKDKDNVDKNGNPNIVNVQGTSIQGAMALARRWGNCANAWRVSPNADPNNSKILVEGVFLDYETNVRTVRTISVSTTYYNKRMKREVPLNSQRMTMAIHAGGSKAVRNAILASLPEYLKNKYFNKATSIASGKAQGETRPQKTRIKDEYDKLKPILKEHGIAPADIAKLLGKKSINSDEDIIKLKGIANALADGITTKAELLSDEPANVQQVVPGTVKMEDLIGDREPGSEG